MNDGSSPLIELAGVTKRYSGRTVLGPLDLTVSAGELVVLIGRSGSGKSTLLKLVGAIEEPSEGAIRIAGRDIAELAERDRALFRRANLGFVFQFFNLIPTLNVEENVRLPLALNGLERGADGKVAALLDELGLVDCADRFPEELSGGEQQRVAIARALIHAPGLVIADEPTGNLDLETASRVVGILEESCRQRSTTLIMATHSNEVVGLADRVLTISDGALKGKTT